MAAPMKSVRVKLSFDNLINLQGVVPPKSWYLLDYKCLDTIADLERDIIAKYSLSWLRSIDCYVEGCFLPKWESARLIRENDVVKLEVNDAVIKKRKRKLSDVAPAGRSLPRKRIVDTGRGDGKLKNKPQQTSKPASSSDSSSEEDQVKPDTKKTVKKAVPKQPSSSSDSDSDSEDEKQANISQVASTVDQTISQASEKPTPEPTPVADEEENTDRQAGKPKRKRVRKRKKKVEASCNGTPQNPWPVANGRCNSVTPKANNQSSGHIKFDNDDDVNDQCQVVVKETTYTPSPICTPEVAMDTQSYTPQQSQHTEADDSWKSGMASMAENSMAFKPRQVRDSLVAGAQVFTREQRYKAKRNPNFSLSKAEQLSTVATNKSFIFKNPDPAENIATETNSCNLGSPDKKAKSVPKDNSTDYNSYPPLHNPPSAGQVIAYKIVEMSENYCPLVSEYKEAKVLSYDGSLSQLTLEIIKGGKKARMQLGKFDIPNDEDDAEENTVTVSWSSLIDAKLVS